MVYKYSLFVNLLKHMVIRELIEDDYRFPEAAKLVFSEVYGDRSERFDEDRVGALRIPCYVNYCAENSSCLLGVGTIDISGMGLGVASLTNIVVARGFRRKGIGEELVSFLEAESKNKGASIVRLDSLSEARDFYASLGYRCINPAEPLKLAKPL